MQGVSWPGRVIVQGETVACSHSIVGRRQPGGSFCSGEMAARRVTVQE